MLNAHEEIVKGRSTEATVLGMTRKRVRLHISEHGQAESEHVADDHQGSPVVADDGGINEALLHQDEKQKVWHHPSTNTITLVTKHIPGWRGSASSDAAGQRNE